MSDRAKKVTVTELKKMKADGVKIAATTAYDYPFALLADAAGVDMILVGDSLGMAFRGEENTLKVTVDDIAYHTRAVRRGVKRAMLVADMPFLSYRVSREKTVENAGRLIAEGAEAVKIEGVDDELALTIGRLVAAGAPVVGHIGLTPQSIHQLGGYRIQGRRDDEAKKIVAQARLLQEAGACAVVLECVPDDLAEEVTAALAIPTVGIGAGVGCDGQILVINDLLGLSDGHSPKFVKRFADLAAAAAAAVGDYVAEVRGGAFPDADHSYGPAQRRLKALK
jgi:3-methyl-2-oxobutanoate hydroxymethyltransferase